MTGSPSTALSRAHPGVLEAAATVPAPQALKDLRPHERASRPAAPMRVANNRAQLAGVLAAPGVRRGLVMTMGALHEGHAELIRAARRRADQVIVTIFVNPLQFGPGEDLDRYPRTLERDLVLCRREGADVVFAPSPQEVYPTGDPLVRVDPGPLGAQLEGASRPGHFAGVLTVVLKVLHLTAPALAFFGEKDYQQLVLVRRMVADLDVPAEIVGVPIARESDGLARSSRNRYLSPDQRLAARALSRALHAGVRAAPDGREAVLAAARRELAAEPLLTPDRIDLVHPETLCDEVRGPARLLVAALAGTTRLIDNTAVTLGGD